jgi:squalene cyclase
VFDEAFFSFLPEIVASGASCSYKRAMTSTALQGTKMFEWRCRRAGQTSWVAYKYTFPINPVQNRVRTLAPSVVRARRSNPTPEMFPVPAGIKPLPKNL